MPHVGSVRLWVVVAMLTMQLLSCGKGHAPTLSIGGQGTVQIVLATDAAKVDTRAAEELRRYLGQATGMEFPIVRDTAPARAREILIGPSARVRNLGIAIDRDALGADGYTWRTVGKRLAIIGGSGKGSLYGVYAFLEEHVGLRFFTPDVMVVPHRDRIDLPELNEIRRPAFEMRWLHLPAGESDAWCDWHGIHSRGHREKAWGMFVHTFARLVPPSVHFKTHPEAYAMLAGKRSPDYQLCLSSDYAFRTVVDGLRKRMAKRPLAKLWSVSQNDCFGPCECESCAALVSQYGSQAGPLLHFVNRVADEFPGKTISTLAYQYTRRAPRGIKPRPNVNICLCSIECDRAEPLSKGTRNADFARDVREWAALTQNLMIWDYVVQFTSYVSPFPNLHVLQPNIQLFRDHGVRLMFQQGSGTSKSDLFELKQYLIAKLLWNPDADLHALTNDFLRGFYGAAAGEIARYIDRMRESMLGSGDGLQIYGNPVSEGKSWLSSKRLEEADRTLDKAEQLVKGDPERLARVRAMHLSVQFAMLEQGKLYGAGPRGYFERGADGQFRAKATWRERLESFIVGCKKAGFTVLHERGYTPAMYRKDMTRYLEEGMLSHLAAGKEVTLGTPYSRKYEAGGAAALTDQRKGDLKYQYNWLGWEGSDMVATVDLERAMTIKEVRADFLQDIASWIWLPLELRISTSRDGEQYEQLAVLEPKTAAGREGACIESFRATSSGRTARFVRVEARACKSCPSWHHGAGGPSWIFCDEIIVR